MSVFSETTNDENKIISTLALLEARSAIKRLVKGLSLTIVEGRLATDDLSYEAGLFTQQPVNPLVMRIARIMVDRYALKSLDAIQLGSAVIARNRMAPDHLRLVASDRELLAAAVAEGFEIWDPAL